MPIALAVIVALVAVQHYGTAGVGRWFGPIMWPPGSSPSWCWAWSRSAKAPRILLALSPLEAISSAGATASSPSRPSAPSPRSRSPGAEALYADMGHFGPSPIRRAPRLGLVLPSLLVNYYGQGALLLSDVTALENQFFRLGPEWVLYPLVVLAAVATAVIACAGDDLQRLPRWRSRRRCCS